MTTTTNIFRTQYEQPENKLTYSFLCLIEHLDMESVQKILCKAGVRIDGIDSVSVELLYGGSEANPDGSIQINPESEHKLIVYLENKTWRRKLDIPQIERHIKEHLHSTKNLLLVITANKSDKHELASLNDQRVCFVTWHELVDYLEKLAKETIDSKHSFLLQQFAEYAEMSGEAWRAKMVNKKLIDTYSQSLKVKNDLNQFYKDAWRLMESLREEICSTFSQQIQTSTTAKHWGRLGVECDLKEHKLGDWVFFGVYYDTDDHLIDFIEPFQPEYAVILDLPPKKRQSLAKRNGIEDSIKELKKKGFEFNFPENKGNPWRICYWHEPMVKHVDEDVSDLRLMFERQLKILFDSKFYKILEATN